MQKKQFRFSGHAGDSRGKIQLRFSGRERDRSAKPSEGEFRLRRVPPPAGTVTAADRAVAKRSSRSSAQLRQNRLTATGERLFESCSNTHSLTLEDSPWSATHPLQIAQNMAQA